MVNRLISNNEGLFYARFVCLHSFRHLKRHGSETSTNADSESEQDKIRHQHRYRRCSRRSVNQQKFLKKNR